MKSENHHTTMMELNFKGFVELIQEIDSIDIENLNHDTGLVEISGIEDTSSKQVAEIFTVASDCGMFVTYLDCDKNDHVGFQVLN